MRRLASLIFFLLLSSMAQASTVWYLSNNASNGYSLGSDSNNCTALATPCLTIGGVKAKAWASGDTVNVNNNGTGLATYTMSHSFVIDKGVTITANTYGLVTFQTTGSAGYFWEVAPTDGSNVVLNGINLDANNADVYALGPLNETLQYGLTLNRVQLLNPTKECVQASAVTLIAFTWTNSACSAPQAIAGYHMLDFTYNIIGGSITINGGTCNFTLASGGATTVSNCIAINAGVGGYPTVSITGFAVNATGGYDSAGIAPLDAMIEVIDVPNAVIKGNSVLATESAQCTGGCAQTGIWVRADNNGYGNNADIENNGVTVLLTGTVSISPHGIICGEDSSSLTDQGRWKSNNCLMANNVVTGIVGALETHGFLCGNQNGCTMQGNVAYNVGICHLFKGMTGGQMLNNTCYGASSAGMYFKASTNSSAVGEILIYQPTQTCNGSCYMVEVAYDSATNIPSTGIQISATQYGFGGFTPTAVNIVGSGSDASTATFYGGVYKTGNTTQPSSYQGTNYSTIPAWGAAKESSLTVINTGGTTVTVQ